MLENYKLFIFILIDLLPHPIVFVQKKKKKMHVPPRSRSSLQEATAPVLLLSTCTTGITNKWKVPRCRFKLAVMLIESVWAKMSNSALIDLYCTEKCARPSPNPHWRGTLKRILSGTETSFPSSIMLRAWHPCAAQHALYPEHRSKPLSKSRVIMRSIKMSYCCHRKGEPLRTDGGPWIIAPTLTFLWRDQAQAYFHKGVGSLF